MIGTTGKYAKYFQLIRISFGERKRQEPQIISEYFQFMGLHLVEENNTM